MAIHKETASSLRLRGAHYVVLPSKVLKQIRSSDALAIWAYLQSQSEGFIVRPSHIQSHLDIGEIRYGRAMKVLRDMRLIVTVNQRNEAGHIVGNYVDCYPEPFDDADEGDAVTGKSGELFTEPPENPDFGKTRTSVKPGLRETPESGETPPLNKGSIPNQESTNQSLIKADDATAKAVRASSKAKQPAKSDAVWRSYSAAFFERYQTEPPRDAKTNRMLCTLIDSIGEDEAIQVAAFYVGHNHYFYVQKCHEVKYLAADAHKLRTEWATNRKVTSQQARQVEATQANLDSHDGALKLLQQKGLA